MLPVQQRLRRRGDIAAAIRSGRRAGHGALVVHVGLGGAEVSRAGFVVSRAVGSAVVRNVVRRRLRHLVRERLPALPAGTDVVLRALPAAAERSYQQLGHDLDAALTAAMHRGIRAAPAGRGGAR